MHQRRRHPALTPPMCWPPEAPLRSPTIGRTTTSAVLAAKGPPTKGGSSPEADQHISSRNSLLATAQTTRAHTSGRQSGQPHHQRTNHLHSVTGTALSEHNSARDGYSTRLSNRSSKADEPTETLQQPLLTSCTSAANPEPCSNCNPLQEVLL